MGGGPAVMAADALRREGLELPSLSSRTMESLNSMLSPRWSHGNPVDPAGDFVSYHILWPMIEDENTDACIIIGGFGMTDSFSGWAGILPSRKNDADLFRKAMEDAELGYLKKTIELMKRYQKPVLFTTMVTGALRKGKFFKKLERSHIHPYSSPEKAAKALAHLVEYGEYLRVASGKRR